MSHTLPRKAFDAAVSLDFGLNDEERMVLDSIRRFARELRAQMRLSEAQGLDAGLIATGAALGLTELDALGERLLVRALEELAWGDAAATLALLGPVGVVDVDEHLLLEGDRLRGVLPYVPGIGECLQVLKGECLYTLTEGFEATPADVGALQAAGAHCVTVDAVPTSVETLGAEGAAALSAQWRLSIAAMLVGVARAAYEHAREYCLERVSFGKKIAHHQGVAFLLADMVTAVETARLSVDFAAASGSTDARRQGYLQAVESALFVTDYGVQLLGAAGYVSDHPVEKWMREARALSLLLGGVDGALS